jgi:hypothetical protein
MLTIVVSNPQNTISQIIRLVFLLEICLFSIYVGSTSILICFHNGSSVCIIVCILFRPLRCVMRACENLSAFIRIVMAKRKCSINDCIKSEYPFIKGVNENAECTLCNAKFCFAHGGRRGVICSVKISDSVILVVTTCKWLINTITNPNPVFSHNIRDSIIDFCFY